MAKKWRQVLEKSEAEHEKRMDWEETHPSITRISKQEADAKRNIQAVGQEAIICDIPCQGNYIPREYSHTRGVVNVFDRGIKVNGYENPNEGDATYYATTCDLTNGKVCVARDERLRKAIER